MYIKDKIQSIVGPILGVINVHILVYVPNEIFYLLEIFVRKI